MKMKGAIYMAQETPADGKLEIPRISNSKTLKVLANPIRMRILGVLRINGEQTVGSISNCLGEAPGAVSYHLSQLAKVGLAEKAQNSEHDKRQSWWKASQTAAFVESPDRDNAVEEEATDLFRRSAALAYEQTYERYLDALPKLPKEWASAGASSDSVLMLTPDQLKQMNSELDAVARKWAKRGAEQLPGAEQVALIVQAFRWIP